VPFCNLFSLISSVVFLQKKDTVIFYVQH
jgi:hypothetical protein